MAVLLWAAHPAITPAYFSGTFDGSLQVTLSPIDNSDTKTNLQRLSEKLSAGIKPNVTASFNCALTGLLLLLNWVGCLASPLGKVGTVQCKIQGPEVLGLHILLLGLVSLSAVPFLRPTTHAVRLAHPPNIETHHEEQPHYMPLPTSFLRIDAPSSAPTSLSNFTASSA
ncbi:hypothetical protein HK097_011467, partial [Rhizophlyctis rosea]